jgi:unsaturated rhamnogalacturonyl hydrolase
MNTRVLRSCARPWLDRSPCAIFALVVALAGCGSGTKGGPSGSAGGGAGASGGSSGAAGAGTGGSSSSGPAGSTGSAGTSGGAGSGTAGASAAGAGGAAVGGTTGGGGTTGTAGSGGGAPDAGTGGAPMDASSDAPSGPLNASVLTMMRKVADWQLMQGGIDAIDWIHGAMWTGIFATYQATGDAKYLTAIKAWAQAANWALGGGITTNADNQCAAQTYFDTYLLAPGAANMNMVTGAKPSFDAMVTSGNAGWTWEDALFMSPPGLTRLGVIENDPKYFALLDSNWMKTATSLYSAADGLWCRDPNCNGTYWARGNGWVIAGTARVLEYLPATEANHAMYVTNLKTMAAALKPWQGVDGLWRSDITHPAKFPGVESSGTAFMTFAIAWGVNAGILDRATYQPIAQKGWQGLLTCVDATGKLGYVQGVGAAPGATAAGNTQPYAVGAFLLAGAEIAKFGP